MPANRISTNGSTKNKRAAKVSAAKEAAPPTKILAIDIGGTKIKLLATGETEPRKLPSGKKLTPGKLVEKIVKLCADWEYEAISIGYPGQVGSHGPRSEPGNLGPGWVGFDFALAFGKPVRVVNDAAMQALGGYEQGRMLFLGLGTGLGSALIADRVIVPLELGNITYKDGQQLGELIGRAGLAKLGKAAWREIVTEVAATFWKAFVVDHILIGGGNAKHLKDLPPGMRLGNNLNAFRGGFRLWNVEDIKTLPAEGHTPHEPPAPAADWRLV